MLRACWQVVFVVNGQSTLTYSVIAESRVDSLTTFPEELVMIGGLDVVGNRSHSGQIIIGTANADFTSGSIDSYPKVRIDHEQRCEAEY